MYFISKVLLQVRKNYKEKLCYPLQMSQKEDNSLDKVAFEES